MKSKTHMRNIENNWKETRIQKKPKKLEEDTYVLWEGIIKSVTRNESCRSCRIPYERESSSQFMQWRRFGGKSKNKVKIIVINKLHKFIHKLESTREIEATVIALRNCVLKPDNQVMVKVMSDKFYNILQLGLGIWQPMKEKIHLALDQVD